MRASCAMLLALVVMGTGCISERPRLGGKLDPAALFALYEENNRKPPPMIEYVGRRPEVLIYPDGFFMADERNSAEGMPKSRWLVGRFSPAQLTNIVATLASMQGFWDLQPRYQLTSGYDLPACRVTIRFPGRPEKSVSVVGWKSHPEPGDGSPPEGFLRVVEALCAIRPEVLEPWDPGYVEVQFADYSNAFGRSLKWPAKWPSLRSPLVRQPWKGVTVMIFPSELAVELGPFVAARSHYSAVLIDGWKTAVDYRWPLPGEKKWTRYK